MTRTLATVLFADVVSSTERVQAMGDEAWVKTLETFQRAAAHAVSASGGRRIKDTGDGLLVSFGSPVLALRCARSLLDEGSATGLDLRVGIHAGECELTPGGDLRGVAVHLAARIMGAAAPGEILVSSTVKDLVAGAGAAFADRGGHVLKGFEAPVLLFAAQDAPPEATPLRPTSTAALRLTGGPRLVGRSKEVETLGQTLDAAVGGTVIALAVEGEAGIGKSRILGEAVRLAAQRGFVTLVGGADELETDVPFRALREALGLESPGGVDAERAELVALLGARRERLPGEAVADAGGAVTDVTLDVLERLALTSPLLLAMDDLQWADPLTLRVLRAVVQRLAGLPLAVVSVFRPTPRPPDLDRVLDALTANGGRVLRLDPLDDEVVAKLAAEVTGATAGSGLRGRLAGAGGNPLFVTELLRALQDDGALTVTEGTAESASTEVPADFRITLLRRLSTLPSEAVETLCSASVLGSTFTLADLAAIRRCPLSDVVQRLEPAVRAGFVGELGHRMAFRHDLIREAVYEDFPKPVRRALHLEVARVLAEAGRPLPHVAEHYLLGAEPGDEVAVATIRAAAEDALFTSTASAEHLLEGALGLVAPRSRLHDEIVADLSEFLPITGALELGERLVTEALRRRPPPDLEVRLRVGLAALVVARGDMGGAVRQFRGLAQVEGADPSTVRFALNASHAVGVFLDPTAAEVHARGELQRALADEDPYSECLMRQILAFGACARGTPAEGLEHAETVVARLERGELALGLFLLPTFYLGAVLTELDRLEEAIEWWRRGIQLVEASGSLLALPIYSAGLSLSSYERGWWDEADAALTTAVRTMDELDARAAVALFVLAGQARIALHRGDLASAQEVIGKAEAVLATTGPGIGVDLLMWVRALLLEQAAKPDESLALLRATWDLTAHLRYFASWRMIAPDLVRLAVTCDDAERAQSVTEEVEEGAQRNPVSSARGTALLCRGMADDDTDALVAAVEAYRESPRVPDLARAAEIAGKALMSTHPADGETLLKEAFTIWDGLGATADVARVEAPLGGRKPKRRKARATFGWEALTPAELEVAKLVVEGLTNKEAGERLFVSRRTVETHLSHVFTKLEVSSRAQVAAIAARELSRVGE